jgi:hypothetical protein
MRGIAAAAAAVFAVLAADPAVAHNGRQPGDAYHLCSTNHAVAMLAAPGSAPQIASRGRGGRVQLRPWPAAAEDSFSATVEVNADRALQNLRMGWHRPSGAWPQVWRTDLHPFMIRAETERFSLPAGTRTLFDPAMLDIVVTYQSEERLSGPWMFRLGSDARGRERAELVAQAHVPHWRRSAELRVRWGVIEAVAQGERLLNVDVMRPIQAPSGLSRRVLERGNVDLSPMPAVFAGFGAAEAKLLELVAQAQQRCERRIEPEPGPGADI